MTAMTLEDVARAMRDIDICALATHAGGGRIASRPMSNNSQVEFDGDSWYFTYEDAHSVGEIEADPNVTLSFAGKDHVHIVVQGKATLVRDRTAFSQHWTPELDRWFEQGPDTPGIVMIKVRADHISWWNRMDHADIPI